MEFVSATQQQLATSLYAALASYRYRVFVERLGWELPRNGRCEQDEFDRPDTVHVVARDRSGQIVGCGRLLPTTTPYLLERVFPQLLNGLPVPRDARVWELSRFAAMLGDEPCDGTDRHLAERVLLAALRHCAGHGVTHLLAVSTLAVERLMQRAGVDVRRLGPPQIIGGQPVLAFVIGVNERSLAALESFEEAAVFDRPRPAPPRQDGIALYDSLLALAGAARGS
jgi:acyl homoserine lactone synthase